MDDERRLGRPALGVIRRGAESEGQRATECQEPHGREDEEVAQTHGRTLGLRTGKQSDAGQEQAVVKCPFFVGTGEKGKKAKERKRKR
jgi:hypothetical protein